MKRYLCLSLCLGLLTSCGSKSDNNKENPLVQNEEELGLTSQSECGRAEELRGTNFIYRWIKAGNGDLQRFIIQKSAKTIQYDEARTGGTFKGQAPYTFVAAEKKMVFTTTTKSLKLTFPDVPLASIEDVRSGKQYVVAVLSYDDGSGYQDKFLCEIKE